jgi:hypothetical protein
MGCGIAQSKIVQHLASLDNLEKQIAPIHFHHCIYSRVRTHPFHNQLLATQASFVRCRSRHRGAPLTHTCREDAFPSMRATWQEGAKAESKLNIKYKMLQGSVDGQVRRVR